MQKLSQVQSGGGRLKGTEVVLLYVAPCTSVSVMNTLVLITTDETLHYAPNRGSYKCRHLSSL